MNRHQSFVMFAIPTIGILLSAGRASALPLPDNSSCGSAICLKITATDTQGIAISGYAQNNRAIYGQGGVIGVNGNSQAGSGVAGDTNTGNGVYGLAVSGIGVYGESGWAGVVGKTTSTTAAAVSGWSPSNAGTAFYGIGGITITGSTALKSGGGSWGVLSDARIKKEVEDLKWGLDELRRLRPVTFRYNGMGDTDNDGRRYAGVIAQELEKVLPEMVTSRKAKLHKDDAQETNIKVVDPSAFTYLLVNAVKQQQEIIERQEARIAGLERSRGPLSASLLGGGLGGLALALAPLGFVALRRKKS